MAVRVVLAEDEAIIRLDLRETLEAEGYDVVGDFGQGDLALAAIRDLRPDIAILDVKMPGLDGLEVATIIQQERICATLILTAFSQRALVEAARTAGVMAYLVKPFQSSELVPAIELALARYGENKMLEEEMEQLRGEHLVLQDKLETRKLLDQAKGLLMEELGMTEAEAFRFLQRKAMDGRLRLGTVASQVIDGVLRPEPS
ncbi:MAG: ANTAR domain-containing response regulator [Acidimicrobiales bacterium]